MIAVFDTNIVIDALNGLTEADDEYVRYERVFISRITWMEVLVGAQGDDIQLRDFLETHFEIVPLDLVVAERAVHRSEMLLRVVVEETDSEVVVVTLYRTSKFRKYEGGT